MFYFTSVDVNNETVPLKFCHLGWYRNLVWPMD